MRGKNRQLWRDIAVGCSAGAIASGLDQFTSIPWGYLIWGAVAVALCYALLDTWCRRRSTPKE